MQKTNSEIDCATVHPTIFTVLL